ncbi:hypothetical protein [Micromonospora carbonacea]|uniref:hypothetical protein n=1 Tax=Micromonospora carbonacea TaxID=47853 RepID=UPI00371BE3C9
MSTRRVGDGWPAAYKEYSADALKAVDRAALETMVRFPRDLPADQRRELLERVAWPTAVVERGGALSGFLMRQVPAEFMTPLRLPTRYVDKLAQVQLLLNNDAYRAGRELLVDDVFQLEFLRDTAATLDAFHRLDLFVGDLSPNNLLFSRTTRPRCFFIDCDTMRLRGTSVLPQVETVDWEVPSASGEQLATRASDSYKFALLCARLFAGDQTARDAGALSRAGADVRRLAEQGLATDPGARPTLAEWLGPLDRALDAARTSAPLTRSPGSPPAGSPVTGGPALRPPHAARRPPGRAATSPASRHPGPGVPVGTPPAAPRAKLGTLFKIALVGLLFLCAAPRLAACQQWWDGTGSGGTGTAARSGTAVDAPGSDDGDGAATGSSRAADQAEAMAGLLAFSGRDRRKIAPAVQKVTTCADPASAAIDFQRAGEGRREALERARDLRVDRLPDGEALLSSLASALTHSAAADDAFARWARAVARSGCRSAAMTGADRDEGDHQSRLATSAKKRFVTLWTPVAERYGEPVLSYRDI